jgi:hypothetical protein
VKRAGALLIVVAALVVTSSPLLAEPVTPSAHPSIAFDLPAQCHLRDDCWVVNYVDVDPGVAAADFQCRSRTYDGHDGIDLAVRDRAVMAQGVPVVATARGIVRRMRDGMADRGLSDAASREAIAGQECGNGVVIEHGEGWETQYCHLQQGSVRVTVGQFVESGQQLGNIGLSGKTEFPHVHLTVRHQGKVIDPFTGLPQSAGCGGGGASLWRDPRIVYEDVALYHAGFSGTVPRVQAIRDGLLDPPTLSAEADALVLWVDIFGVQVDDRLHFRLLTPDGHTLLDREDHLDKTQARYFAYAGIRRQGSRWPVGTYRGEVTLRREREPAHIVQTRVIMIPIQ